VIILGINRDRASTLLTRFVFLRQKNFIMSGKELYQMVKSEYRISKSETNSNEKGTKFKRKH